MDYPFLSRRGMVEARDGGVAELSRSIAFSRLLPDAWYVISYLLSSLYSLPSYFFCSSFFIFIFNVVLQRIVDWPSENSGRLLEYKSMQPLVGSDHRGTRGLRTSINSGPPRFSNEIMVSFYF